MISENRDKWVENNKTTEHCHLTPRFKFLYLIFHRSHFLLISAHTVERYLSVKSSNTSQQYPK